MNNIIDLYGFLVIELTLKHVGYVFLSVIIGLVSALALGILLSRNRKKSKTGIDILCTFLNIPGLIFIGIASIYLGDSMLTLLIGLGLCALFPILKYTYIGLLNVPLEYIEAARGCGMNPYQSLVNVELPLAMPMIFRGIRQAVRFTNGWTMLAPMVGQSSLGQFIYTGIITSNSKLIVIGLIPSIIVAIILPKVIDIIEKKVIPSGVEGLSF